MDKKLFNQSIEEIEVPKEKVSKAIQKGINRVDVSSCKRVNTRARPIISSVAIVGVMIVFLYLIFPSVGKSLADIPVVNSLYSYFNDSIGSHLASQQLVTNLNKEVKSNGIQVALTSIYYDGAVMGITFNVKGDGIRNTKKSLRAVYNVYGGNPNIDDSIGAAHMKSTKNGYVGHIRFYDYHDLNLPNQSTLPISFVKIGGHKGTWNFKVPVKQLPFKRVAVDQQSTYANGDLKVHFDSIIGGKSSTVVNYTTTVPKSYPHVSTRLILNDDKDKDIRWLTQGSVSTKVVNGKRIIKGRTVLPTTIHELTNHLQIVPMLSFSAKNQFIHLDHELPVTLKTKVQHLSVKVEHIKMHGDQVIIDSQINNGNWNGQDFTFLKDVAKTGMDLVKPSEKDILGNSIPRTVQVLNRKQLKFRSIYDIGSVPNFNDKDYLFRVGLGLLTTNMPLHLPPVTIPLNK